MLSFDRGLFARCKPLSLILFAALLSACSSDGTGPEGSDLYFRFRVDGTLIEYTTPGTLFGAFASVGTQHNLVVSGLDATSNAALQVYDAQPVTTGTYSGYTLDLAASAFVGVLLHYEDPSGTVYAQGLPAVTIATITEITDTRVKGTFAATLQATGKADIAVTDGEFVVQRTN